MPRKSHGEEPNEHAGHAWQRNQFWFETLHSGSFVERNRRIICVSQNAFRRIVCLVNADVAKAKIPPKTPSVERKVATALCTRLSTGDTGVSVL